MKRLRITLPDSLFVELQKSAAAVQERGYGPAHYAAELVSAELAARRLARIAPTNQPPRMTRAG